MMPQMGESITEGTITKWLKKVGDTIARDEPLFEISTDKVDAEIPSPAAGVHYRDRAAEGATVSINTVVAVIGGGSAPAAGIPAVPGTPAPSAAAPAAATAATEILMPQMGESITEGTITKCSRRSATRSSATSDLRDLHRQGRCGDSVTGRRHPDRNQSAGRPDGQHQHRRCADRRHRRRHCRGPLRSCPSRGTRNRRRPLPRQPRPVRRPVRHRWSARWRRTTGIDLSAAGISGSGSGRPHHQERHGGLHPERRQAGRYAVCAGHAVAQHRRSHHGRRHAGVERQGGIVHAPVRACHHGSGQGCRRTRADAWANWCP